MCTGLYSYPVGRNWHDRPEGEYDECFEEDEKPEFLDDSDE